MTGPTLTVMAAGMGSRFGGLKQIADCDGAGHALIDYAVYDAVKAGFSEVVFIIREDIAADFKQAVGNRISEKVPVTYVYQDLSRIPGGMSVPEDRVKPWGTTHAIWCAKDALRGKQFLTINADDFYGFGAFDMAAGFFRETEANNIFANISYGVVGTLSDKGTVSRGICKVSGGRLVRIDERKKIELRDGKGFYLDSDGETWKEIGDDSVASMNMWAFNPGFIDDIEVTFEERLTRGIKEHPLTFEETLSEAVQEMLSRDAAEVKVLPVDEKWIGMTYKEDAEIVKEYLNGCVAEGKYIWD